MFSHKRRLSPRTVRLAAAAVVFGGTLLLVDTIRTRRAHAGDVGGAFKMTEHTMAPASELEALLRQKPDESIWVLEERTNGGKRGRRSFSSPGSVRGDYMKYKEIIDEAHVKTGLPVALIDAIIRTESGYRPNARSWAGAEGLMQLMPRTAQSVGVSNRRDPRQNVLGGCRYLRQMYNRFGSIRLAIAAYNGGPGAIRSDGQISYAPGYAETRRYVPVVLQRYYSSQLSKEGAEQFNGW